MQVVVSGLTEDINSSEKIFTDNGVKRYVKLNVSAAFHSKYMLDAQKILHQHILNTNFSSPDIPIISNFNAKINKITVFFASYFLIFYYSYLEFNLYPLVPDLVQLKPNIASFAFLLFLKLDPISLYFITRPAF